MSAPARFGLAGIAACLLLACTTTGDAPLSLQNGEHAYREGRYRDAELIWLESLAEARHTQGADPRLAQSLRMLGNLYVRQERLEEARPLLEHWLEIHDRQPITFC